MFYLADIKEPEYLLSDMLEWSALLDLEMSNAALPPIFTGNSEREIYFRSAYLYNERVTCRTLSLEFQSGPHSISAFLDRSSQFIKTRSLLGVSSKDVAKARPEDFIVSANASNATHHCAFSLLVDGLDPFNTSEIPTIETIITSRLLLDFVGAFWAKTQQEKVDIIQHMVELIAGTECATGGLVIRSSAITCAAYALAVLDRILNGTTADFDLNTNDFATSIKPTLDLINPINNLLKTMYDLRTWVVNGSLPSLGRLTPETTGARFSFLETMRHVIPSEVVDLLELQRQNNEY
jgi:hypothetical protein